MICFFSLQHTSIINRLIMPSVGEMEHNDTHLRLRWPRHINWPRLGRNVKIVERPAVHVLTLYWAHVHPRHLLPDRRGPHWLLGGSYLLGCALYVQQIERDEIDSTAHSTVATAPAVERAHQVRFSGGMNGCRRGFFSHICFVQMLDTYVALQWDYDVPVVYEARVASVIFRRTFKVYRL